MGRAAIWCALACLMAVCGPNSVTADFNCSAEHVPRLEDECLRLRIMYDAGTISLLPYLRTSDWYVRDGVTCVILTFGGRYVNLRVKDAGISCKNSCAVVQQIGDPPQSAHKVCSETSGVTSPRMLYNSNGLMTVTLLWTEEARTAILANHTASLLLSYEQSTNGVCQDSSVRCGELGHCLPTDLLCDGRADCSGGLDESPPHCTTEWDACKVKGLLSCGGSGCYTGQQRCDGTPDCAGAEDELECTRAECQGFLCGADVRGRCVPLSSRCDQKAQCPDCSDERGCLNTPPGVDPCHQEITTAVTTKASTSTPTSTSPSHTARGLGLPCGHTYNVIQSVTLSSTLVQPFAGALPCIWRVRSQPDAVVMVRFTEFNAPSSRVHLSLTDAAGGGTTLAYYGLTVRPPPSDEWQAFSTSLLALRLDIDDVSPPLRHRNLSQATFNMTLEFRTSDVCLENEIHCYHGDKGCYTSKQKCDGKWFCPSGADEMGCGTTCKKDEFVCAGATGEEECYTRAQMCDGFSSCRLKEDEQHCENSGCAPENGTLLCPDGVCIRQEWICDGGDDCADGSDEVDCNAGASTRVVLAAVIGSLICGMLVVIAAGCTRRLLSYRLQDRSGDARYTSPMTALQNEFSQRRPPPTYTEAMETSRPFDEVHREFLAHVERAASLRSGGGASSTSGATDAAVDAASAAADAAYRQHRRARHHPRQGHRSIEDRAVMLGDSPVGTIVSSAPHSSPAAVSMEQVVSAADGASSEASRPAVPSEAQDEGGSVAGGGGTSSATPSASPNRALSHALREPSLESLEAVSIVVGLSAQYRRHRAAVVDPSLVHIDATAGPTGDCTANRSVTRSRNAGTREARDGDGRPQPAAVSSGGAVLRRPRTTGGGVPGARGTRSAKETPKESAQKSAKEAAKEDVAETLKEQGKEAAEDDKRGPETPPDVGSVDFDGEEDGSVSELGVPASTVPGTAAAASEVSRGLRRRFSVESESCLSLGGDSTVSDDVPLLR